MDAKQAYPIVRVAVSEGRLFDSQKPYLTEYGPLRFTTYAGTLLMLVFAPGFVWAAMSVAFIGAFPKAAAYLALGYAFAGMPASKATSLLYPVPGIAFLIAWLGEAPPALSVAGGAVALDECCKDLRPTAP